LLRRILNALIVLVLAGALIAAAPIVSSARTCQTWGPKQPPNSGTFDNELAGATVLSRCSAWAVGWYSNGEGYPFPVRTLIEHWNGTAWKVQASPSPGTDNNFNDFLTGVAATSQTNAWAVGRHNDNANDRTLIEHWNGTAWSVQASPKPGTSSDLGGVAALSATNAWAVGSYYNGTADRTLIEHWNGRRWKVRASPNVGATYSNALGSVVATSPTNAWAVGSYMNFDRDADETLILHWNGTSWRRQPSPNPAGTCHLCENVLGGVAATSRTNAWAVGDANGRTLILHWNGRAWRRQPSPSPGTGDNRLSEVVATSPTNAWAVGAYFNNDTPYRTLILHWNGTAWRRQPSPNPGTEDNLLVGVAASSATNVWSVGNYSDGTMTRALALHCC
jgi:hypothetical protein